MQGKVIKLLEYQAAFIGCHDLIKRYDLSEEFDNNRNIENDCKSLDEKIEAKYNPDESLHDIDELLDECKVLNDKIKIMYERLSETRV